MSKLQEMGLEAGWAPDGFVQGFIALQSPHPLPGVALKDDPMIFVKVEAERINSYEWRSWIVAASQDVRHAPLYDPLYRAFHYPPSTEKNLRSWKSG